jgi:hypothetical protein
MGENGEKMKKALLVLIAFLALLCVGSLFVVDVVLEKASNKAVEVMAAEGESRGIKVQFAKFGDVGLRGFREVQWKDFVAVINAPKYISLAPGEEVVLSIGEMNLDIPRLFKGVAAITAYEIGVRVKHDSASTESLDAQVEGIDQGQFIVEYPIDFTDKEKLIAALMEAPQMALQFLQEGKTKIPFGFRARSSFKIGGSVAGAQITTRKQGGYYFLVMSPDEMRKIVAKLNADLTEEEIRLVSLNPLLAPALFKITNHARSQAEAAHARDAAVPEDAYRHVLWSFLLTKAFGPEFAEQITNAHEIGSVQFNTEADHRMDYNNNKVGRDYVKAGYAEAQILQMVRTDPQVIRVAQP